MSVEEDIKAAIDSAIDNIEIDIRLDGDNDIEVNLIYNGRTISSSYVGIDDVFLKIEP